MKNVIWQIWPYNTLLGLFINEIPTRQHRPVYSYDYFIKILTSLGYSDDKNICDFWFSNLEEVRRKVPYRMQVYIDRFGLEVRWKSQMGIACNEAVKEYIFSIKQEYLQASQALIQTGRRPPFPSIDFRGFQFSYDNRTLEIDDFTSQYATSKVGGLADFRGIDMSEVSIGDAEISNTCFVYAKFNNSTLFQVIFKNVNFVSADLRNTHITNITLAERSSFAGADLRGACVNIIRDINDITVAYPFKFETVSWLYLVRALVLSLFTDRQLIFDDARKHTKFSANDVSGIKSSGNKVLCRYIDWYQFVFSELSSLRSQPIKKKIFFSLSLMTTKAWSSYIALSVTGLVINLLFALIINLNYCHFKGLDEHYFSAFYYSIVTFTTLGYGEITPLGFWPQLLVVIEVVLGYITLGVFVYLLSRKVSDKF